MIHCKPTTRQRVMAANAARGLPVTPNLWRTGGGKAGAALNHTYAVRRGPQQSWHSCYGCRTLVSQGTLYYLSMPVLDGSLAAVTARDPICLYGAICVGKIVFKASRSLLMSANSV